MNDERYLWDRSGEVDPEITRLEALLAPHRHEAPWDGRTPGVSTRPARRVAFRLAAAAMLLLAVGALTVVGVDSRSWDLSSMEIARSVGAGDLIESGRSAATLSIPRIGTIEIAPDSRLVITRAGLARASVDLIEGTMEARISAPPRIFVATTPSGDAIDLGCAYTLTVDRDRGSELAVHSGWVAFQSPNRTIYVPGGMQARIRGDRVGTPVRTSASPRLHALVSSIDFASAVERQRDLPPLLALAARADRLTLWHLLENAQAHERATIASRIGELDRLPKGITLEALSAGDPAAIERYGEELGIDTSYWWSVWLRKAWRSAVAVVADGAGG